VLGLIVVGGVLAVVGVVLRAGNRDADIGARRAMVATATACPKPAVCTGRTSVVGDPVDICAPEALTSKLIGRGDIVVARRGSVKSIGRIEDVSNAGTFLLRDPGGSLTSFSRSEIEARVCR
jgi:hypothetical protein